LSALQRTELGLAVIAEALGLGFTAMAAYCWIRYLIAQATSPARALRAQTA